MERQWNNPTNKRGNRNTWWEKGGVLAGRDLEGGEGHCPTKMQLVCY